MPISPFDFDQFSQTTVDATAIDTMWHSVPDRTEAQAQVVDMGGQGLDPDKFNGRPVAAFELVWLLQDDQLKADLNMDEVRCRQRFVLDLTRPQDQGGRIDWGPNKNQALKDTMVALNLNSTKNFSLANLKHQIGWVVVRHRPNAENPDRPYAEVVRVRDLSAGRAAWEAKQAA